MPSTNIEFAPLVQQINTLTTDVHTKINEIRNKKDAVSVADMFDLQLKMNGLSQMTEMSTSVVAAVNNCIKSITSHLAR